MTTLDLARKMGVVQSIHTPEKVFKQPFDYLLVLDFEATCWKNGDRKQQFNEIIEFPVVVYDVKHNLIVDEFQKYVKPTENPALSEFCTELTGIRQEQVDNGIILTDCLSLFTEWLEEKMVFYKMGFNDLARYKCAFATWSDWDLGVCLRRECSRKKIRFCNIFRKRMDIRALYKMHYKIHPFGLSGALNTHGMVFEGNEHCGLHDARNTAKLIGKMIENGLILELTKS